MATRPPAKPHVKLAASLVFLGSGLFTLERYGMSRIEQPGAPVHIDPTILSLMVLVPVGLVVAGAVIFLVGRMRRP